MPPICCNPVPVPTRGAKGKGKGEAVGAKVRKKPIKMKVTISMPMTIGLSGPGRRINQDQVAEGDLGVQQRRQHTVVGMDQRRSIEQMVQQCVD